MKALRKQSLVLYFALMFTEPRRDEEVPEEAFRHMFSRCSSLENQMEFERESLVQRYRKHCQFGPLVPEKTRPQQPEKQPVPAATTTTTTGESRNQENIAPCTPSGGLRFPRSCKSAEVPGTPKVSTRQQCGRFDDDIESLLPTRSHSVIDDSKLRAYGLTLPPDEKTARLLELAGKFIARAESAGVPPAKPAQSTGPRHSGEEQQDEGYDSKISSNDADAADEDEVESRVVQLDAQSDKVYPESEIRGSEVGTAAGDAYEPTTHVWADSSRVATSGGLNCTSKSGFSKPDASRPQAQTMPQYQAPTDSGRAAIAKLMYSQRDKNLYERTPNRRMRQNGFRYAGKEQSRLMETSLNHITPGYLSLHQFAYLSNFVQYPLIMHEQQNQQQQQLQEQQQQHQQLHENDPKLQQQQQQPDPSSNTYYPPNSTPSRTIVMRKICLQDSNDPDSNHFTLEAKSRSSEISAESPNQETYCEQLNVHRGPSASCTVNGNGAQSEIPNKTQGASSNHQTAHAMPNSSYSEDPQNVIAKSRAAGTSGPPSHDELDANITRQRQASGSGHRDTQAAVVPRHYNAPDTVVHGQRRTSQTTIPGFRYRNAGSGLRPERLSTTCFPVADLLPAVEKSLRRKGRRGS
ncbi:hypothetical protein ElyMa_002488700 [Elysia marginata]|uniref:LEM domain-containing protein n=1 Tax=Elysia marginata TaxID=1093978 RepID=A0AAV4GRU5_9GAST|nr:hypothetical protein ElyMa_002488700 [Elysia marginata]